YDFASYKALTEAMRARDMTPLYILDYSNKLYEENRSVKTEAGREAFARFAAQAVKELGKGILWEIWNEPNLKQFWEDQPSVDDYVRLVEVTARAIREVDAEATILAPATSEIPRDFLRECFERGMLEHIDVVSVHPYRSRNPETVLPEYVELRNLIQEFSPDREIPIVSGEWGYSVHKYGDVQITEHMQAQYLAREFLVNLMAKIRVSIWYDWKNDGTDPGER